MMMKKETNILLKMIKSSLMELPTPPNISYFWNLGSLLGMILVMQVATGLLLAMHYTGDISIAFNSVVHIMREVNYGWMIRSLHANGASFFFMFLYVHILRGMYYSSYLFLETWIVGVAILLMVMATAFVGYVLPWGQMSFWGATVITNLVSAVPYVGESIVQWVWGGFAVDNATLTRFFSIHFMLPFMIMAMVIVHLLFLHQTGSNNPLGISAEADSITFHPYFTFSDILGFSVMLSLIVGLSIGAPFMLGDVENFIPANPLVTPVHIQPEWYFLFAYAILRSIPNKLGGVVALVLSITILLIMPILHTANSRGEQFYPINQTLFWTFVNSAILLTWIGARPVEEPYILTGQVVTVVYFSYFILKPIMSKMWDEMSK